MAEPTAVPPTAVPEAVKATEAPAAAAGKYQEAPMLAELVQAGSLPPVDERLPINPAIMESYEGIGNYGGNWRRGFKGVSDRWGPTKLQDRNWAWFDKDLNLQPRLMESWQVSDDGREWTIKLREGAKWSDGTEFTTDDFAFWYEHELQNKKINPGLPTVWRSDAETPVEFTAVDKYTAKFAFTKPKPMLIYYNTRGGMGGPMTPPALGAAKPAAAGASPQPSRPPEAPSGDAVMAFMGRKPQPITQLGETRCWATISVLAGGPLTLSDRLSQLNAAGWQQIETMFSLFTGEAARPLDLLASETPTIWVRAGSAPLLALFNWGDAPAEVQVTTAILPTALRGALVDAWSGQEYQANTDALAVPVAPRDVALLRPA